MKRAIALATACLLTLLALSTPVAHASRTDRTSPPAGAGQVFVEEAGLRQIPSWDANQPTSAILTVQGMLPTPCHEARWTVEATDGSIEVALWSESPKDVECIQVIEPFAIVIPIVAMSEGELVVRLNGEEVGHIDDRATIVANQTSLVGAGWSFGFCGGLCRAELAIDGSRVAVTAGDHVPVPDDTVNRGRLTLTGSASLDEAMKQLDGTELQRLYGCPDCADGGAASLTFEQGGVLSEHLMNFGSPPDELGELYRLSMRLIDALMDCRSDAFVSVDETCVPVEVR